ncbi:MAG: lysylphosphatidylglycerol synthase transmembrane domain-containing protein [Vicinamibacterales bacterium]
MTRRHAISLGIAGVLAAVLLYYSLRGIDWTLVGHTVAHAAPAPLAFAALLSTVTLFLRAVRWRVLLNAEGSVTVPTAFWATAAGYFGNNFLPARGGELVRTLMISSRHTLQSAYVLATALAERVADAIALVVISAAILLTLPSPPGWLSAAARPFGILGLVGAGIIGVLPLFGPALMKLIERLPMPHAWRPRALDAVEHGLRGLRAFHAGPRLGAFLAFTILIWCIDAFGARITAAALGYTMSLPAAFLLMAGLGLGSALPSTPGYIGVYQFAAVTVLTPFGFSRTSAITYILVAQVMMYLVIGFWGALGLARYRAGLRFA